MSFHRLKSLENNLDKLFNEVSLLEEDDINKAHLSRYLCVRTSGFLENVTRHLIANLCDGTSPQTIKSFVQKRSKNITNLSFTKMTKLLSEFDNNWGIEFTQRLSDQQKESLNSVVSNRNNIAHGNQDSISFRVMKEYYKDVKEVTYILIDIMKK